MTKKPIHEFLCEVLGSKNCYLNPPTGLHMNYPCITYRLNGFDTVHADNILYKSTNQYLLTYIDYEPDSPMVKKILGLPYCRFDRSYFADGLNHFVFILYY